MKQNVTLLLDRFDEAWNNFQKYSGKEFWKGANNRPHGMYQGYLKTMYETITDMRDALVEFCDAGAHERLCGKDGERSAIMSRILEDTLSRCPYKTGNEDIKERIESIITYIKEVAELTPVVTKVCRVCGKELPLSAYFRNATYKDGYMTKCKECIKKEEKERNDRNRAIIRQASMNSGKPLSAYTPRELMAELARRGYSGKLEYVEKHTIDITDF